MTRRILPIPGSARPAFERAGVLKLWERSPERRKGRGYIRDVAGKPESWEKLSRAARELLDSENEFDAATVRALTALIERVGSTGGETVPLPPKTQHAAPQASEKPREQKEPTPRLVLQTVSDDAPLTDADVHLRKARKKAEALGHTFTGRAEEMATGRINMRCACSRMILADANGSGGRATKEPCTGGGAA